MRIRFFSCPLDLLNKADIAGHVTQALRGRERLRIEGLNVAKLVAARSDRELLEALNDSEIVHLDGAGIRVGLRTLGVHPPERWAGIDLMLEICRTAAAEEKSVFLLGATYEVVARTAQRLQVLAPGIKIAGIHDGYFSEEEGPAIALSVQRSSADVLFIGMSSPKKEAFLRKYWEMLGVKIAMGVGGSFDVISGRLRRAPWWIQKINMEWFYRLVQEPRRLFFRYTSSNTTFLLWLASAMISRRQRRTAVVPDPSSSPRLS